MKTATCTRCKKTKPMSQLNGYNPISGDTSRAYCRRLTDCSQQQIQHLTALVTGAKPRKI